MHLLSNGGEIALTPNDKVIGSKKFLLERKIGSTVSVDYCVSDYFDITSPGTYSLLPVMQIKGDLQHDYFAVINLDIGGTQARTALDTAVTAAILSENKEAFLSGECSAEAHAVLYTEKKPNQTVAYCLTEYGQFGFEDDCFVMISGGSVPVVYTFDTSGGEYVLTKAEEPSDGESFGKSIKKLFPGDIADGILDGSLSEKHARSMILQLQAYAETYLTGIGRSAEIYVFGEQMPEKLSFFHALDLSAEIANKISNYTELQRYPDWLGTKELVENGTRYVYETSYEGDSEFINYTKYVYDTRETAETYSVKVKTGELVSGTH